MNLQVKNEFIDETYGHFTVSTEDETVIDLTDPINSETEVQECTTTNVKTEDSKIKLENLVHEELDVKFEESAVSEEFEHVRRIEPIGGKPFECVVRDYLSQVRNNFWLCVGFKCRVCDYQSSKMSNMEVHIMKHIGIQPFKCKLCDYRCSMTRLWKVRKKRHGGVKIFECKIYTFSIR